MIYCTLNDRPDQSVRMPWNCLEDAAREALSSQFGRSLTDLEWAGARADLLELAAILRRWHRQAEATNGSRADSVVPIRQAPTRDLLLDAAA